MEQGARFAMADSFCKQAHKYKIVNADKMSLDQLMSAIKDRKSAYSPSSTKERPYGFQDDSTRSKDPASTGLEPIKYPVSSMGNDYDSCVTSLSGPAPDGLGVDIQTARDACAKQWLGKGTINGKGQSKSASVTNFELPAWVWTTMQPEAIERIERQVSQESRLRNASATTEVPAWLATSLSYAELASEQDKLDSANNQNRLKSASTKQQKTHEEYIRSIHEPIYKAQERRAENLRQASKERVDSSSLPAWAICAGYGLD